jgi:DNA (cytosine-5)-methyltransferase 1
MNELSLFSGAGGGLLASKYFLGWRTLGYVEINDYCQRVIAQRIKDGLLSIAPIFGDIKTFIDDGYAKRYKSMVDVISGGFPCQPFSVEGKRKAGQDERNMWPATREVIDIVRPSYAFLENVPGLISCGYLGNILSDLAQIGYDARWCCLSAANCGAPHKRERLWIVANSKSKSRLQANQKRMPSGAERNPWPFFKCRGRKISTRESWLLSESNFIRKIDGLANRMDRSKAIGNGQVPQVAATAWRILTEGLF